MSARAPFRNKSVVLFALYNESRRRGWTYDQMAVAAGVARVTVQSWVRGDRTPYVFNMETWAKALGGFLAFNVVDEGKEPPVVEKAPAGPRVTHASASRR